MTAIPGPGPQPPEELAEKLMDLGSRSGAVISLVTRTLGLQPNAPIPSNPTEIAQIRTQLLTVDLDVLLGHAHEAEAILNLFKMYERLEKSEAEDKFFQRMKLQRQRIQELFDTFLSPVKEEYGSKTGDKPARSEKSPRQARRALSDLTAKQKLQRSPKTQKVARAAGMLQARAEWVKEHPFTATIAVGALRENAAMANPYITVVSFVAYGGAGLLARRLVQKWSTWDDRQKLCATVAGVGAAVASAVGFYQIFGAALLKSTLLPAGIVAAGSGGALAGGSVIRPRNRPKGVETQPAGEPAGEPAASDFEPDEGPEGPPPQK